MNEKLIRLLKLMAKGKIDHKIEDGVDIVFLHTDVSVVAYLMMLGKNGINCKIAKPQQIVKQGMDTVMTCNLVNCVLTIQSDKRGFIDVLTIKGK